MYKPPHLVLDIIVSSMTVCGLNEYIATAVYEQLELVESTNSLSSNPALLRVSKMP